jgi:hypothetical protein
MPFYTGNPDVGLFTAYWTGKGLGDEFEPWSSEATLRRLRDIHVFAVTDYLAWCYAERDAGKWDFAAYQKTADAMRSHNIEYVPFCWVHYPPRWYLESARFVPYVNLATGESIPQVSLWSPDLKNIHDRFYGALAREMGGTVSFIRLGMPSEYGEIGYCAGMTKWLMPQPHAGPGFWCGDVYAKRDFAERMLERYGTLEALNKSWGTAFADGKEIAMPDPKTTAAELDGSAALRHRWLDFIDWYDGAWERTLEELTGIVRKHFPGKEIVASLGYGSERDCTGNDEGRYIKAMARLGLSSQSAANVGAFVPRRVASACRFYGVPYYTEPPGRMTRDQEMDRMFEEISNGTDRWFDYPGNLEGAKDVIAKYGALLTGKKPRIDVALWYPTTDQELDPDADWSGPTILGAEALRQAIDYEVVDDRMIRDGALDKMGFKCVVLMGARWLDRGAWEKVLEWTRRGGLLVVGQGTAMRDVEGAEDLWREQSVGNPPKAAAMGGDAEKVFDAGEKRLGAGVSVVFDANGMTGKEKVELVAKLCVRDGSCRNAARVTTPEVRGVYAARFDGEVVYYNSTREGVMAPLDDSGAGARGEVNIPGRSIRVVAVK